MNNNKIFALSLFLGLLCFAVFLPSMASAEYSPTARITFTFDDVNSRVYTNAATIFEQYQIPAVLYAETLWLDAGDEWAMTWDQVKDLQNRLGWEIGSHTINHIDLTKATDEQLENELAGSKQSLASQGINVKTFATPMGSYDSRVLSAISKYYESHRAAWGGQNTWPQNDYEILVLEATHQTTPETVMAWIDEAIANNQWLVILMHDVVDGIPLQYEYNKNDLKKIVAYAVSQPIQITTISDSVELNNNPNLILNGSFEALENDFATNWTRTDSLNVTIDTNQNGNTPNSQNSLKFTGTNKQIEAYSDFVNVENKDYILKMFQNSLNLTAGGWAVWVNEYDSNEAWTGGQWLGGNYWPSFGTKYFLYKPTSASVSKIKIHIYTDVNSIGVLYIDSVKLFEATTEYTAPVVTITAPSMGSGNGLNLSETSATIRGNVRDMGNAGSVDTWFQWGTTSAYGNETTHIARTTLGIFDVELQNLAPGTTYYFRAVGQNSAGIAYGARKVFTTLIPSPGINLPSMGSGNGLNLSETSATIRGNVRDMGNASSIDTWFQWGATSAYGNETTHIARTTLGIFDVELQNLTPGTTYYFRAVGQNSAGTAYGARKTFTTLAQATPPPTPPQPPSNNLILNPSLENGTTLPNNWSQGTWGTNDAVFNYPVSGYSGNGADITISSYTDGDAKWFFDEVIVVPGEEYTFSDFYKSNTSTRVTARFTNSDGTYLYLDFGYPVASAGWIQFSHSFTAPQNVSSLTMFHLIESSGTLSVDHFSLTKNTTLKPTFNQGMVTLSFDDGWLSTYQNGIPVLNNYGINSTQYIVSGELGNYGYINSTQMFDMQSQGHEIAAHSITHADLSTLTNEQITQEVLGSKQDLEALGANTITSFAYPYGTWNENIKSIVGLSGYQGARTALVQDGGLNYANQDPFLLKTVSVEVNTPVSEVQQWIAEAVNSNTWLILVFHQIENEGGQYSTTPQNLESIAGYISSNGIKTVTIGQGLAELIY